MGDPRYDPRYIVPKGDFDPLEVYRRGPRGRGIPRKRFIVDGVISEISWSGPHSGGISITVQTSGAPHGLAGMSPGEVVMALSEMFEGKIIKMRLELPDKRVKR